jgi:hypothetical protein
LPGVDIHSEQHHKHHSWYTMKASNTWFGNVRNASHEKIAITATGKGLAFPRVRNLVPRACDPWEERRLGERDRRVRRNGTLIWTIIGTHQRNESIFSFSIKKDIKMILKKTMK